MYEIRCIRWNEKIRALSIFLRISLYISYIHLMKQAAWVFLYPHCCQQTDFFCPQQSWKMVWKFPFNKYKTWDWQTVIFLWTPFLRFQSHLLTNKSQINTQKEAAIQKLTDWTAFRASINLSSQLRLSRWTLFAICCSISNLKRRQS